MKESSREIVADHKVPHSFGAFFVHFHTSFEIAVCANNSIAGKDVIGMWRDVQSNSF